MEIIINGKNDLFILQDFIYDVYEALSKKEIRLFNTYINSSKGMKQMIFSSWMHILFKDLFDYEYKEEGKNILDLLINASKAINYGINDYLIKKNERSLFDNLRNGYYKEEDRPFMVTIDLDDKKATMDINKEEYEAIAYSLKLIQAFNDKDIDLAVNLFNEIYILDKDKIHEYLIHIFKFSVMSDFYKKYKRIIEEFLKYDLYNW